MIMKFIIWTTKLNLRVEVRFGLIHYSCQPMISLSGLCSFTSAYFWYPLAIYANQQKSITVMITSEGCWVFVMRETWLVLKQWVVGSYTRPNLPSTSSFRFVGFNLILTSSHVCPDSQEIFLCFRGTACFVSHRLLSPGTNDDMLTWHSEHSVAWWHGGSTQQKNLKIPIKANSRAAPPLTIN